MAIRETTFLRLLCFVVMIGFVTTALSLTLILIELQTLESNVKAIDRYLDNIHIKVYPSPESLEANSYSSIEDPFDCERIIWDHDGDYLLLADSCNNTYTEKELEVFYDEWRKQIGLNKGESD